MRRHRLIVLSMLLSFVASCAQPPLTTPLAETPSEHPAPASERMSMPQLVTTRAAQADQALIKLGLIPLLRYEPGIVTDAGVVVNTDPAGGSLVELGETVTVHIAGPPGSTLTEYVDAHRDIFTGVGADANGVLVVGVVESADIQHELSQLDKLAGGKSFRLQTCERSWVDLTRIQVELSRRRFLPGADKLAYATAIDPLACALRMTADLSDAETAELTGRYSGALVIQKGTARRGG